MPTVRCDRLLRGAALGLALALASCGGNSLAPRYAGVDEPPPVGMALVGHASVRGKHRVVVERGAEILCGSGLFESVRESEAPETDADVAFVVGDMSDRANPIPLFTGLTLGLLPCYGTDEVGMHFWIVKPEHLRGTCITIRQYRTWGMGWVFLPKVLDPDWEGLRLWENERLGHQFRRVVDEASAHGAFTREQWARSGR